MKIVVIGGTGRIGSKVVAMLRERGHQPVAASPDTGVDTLTGQGLAEVLAGASVVVDVSNSPAFDEDAARRFFETATRNLLDAEAAAGVGHHVVLSVVGTDRPNDIGYFHAKAAQEELIEASGLPYSIVHATQFFEFLKGIVDTATQADTVTLPPVLFQPMAADDVAAAVTEAAVAAPTNRVTEIGGPEQFRLDDLVRHVLTLRGDPRQVVTDPDAPYFGARVGERTLVPADGARRAPTRLDDWLRQTASA